MDVQSDLSIMLTPGDGDYPTDLGPEAVAPLAPLLRELLADVFVLYLKTKSFHWHVGGSHFREYHLLLDEQADQLFAMTDVIAERSLKLGASTLRSIGDVIRHRRLDDCDKTDLVAADMLRELRSDNVRLTRFLRDTRAVSERFGDVATASLIDSWIDEAERRTWFVNATLRD